MGQSADLAQIPSTARLVRLVLGAISFCLPTAGVALLAYAFARFVELRHWHRRESDRSWCAPNSAPMPSHPCPHTARQHRIPRTKETGT